MAPIVTWHKTTLLIPTESPIIILIKWFRPAKVLNMTSVKWVHLLCLIHMSIFLFLEQVKQLKSLLVCCSVVIQRWQVSFTRCVDSFMHLVNTEGKLQLQLQTRWLIGTGGDFIMHGWLHVYCCCFENKKQKERKKTEKKTQIWLLSIFHWSEMLI